MSFNTCETKVANADLLITLLAWGGSVVVVLVGLWIVYIVVLDFMASRKGGDA